MNKYEEMFLKYRSISEDFRGSYPELIEQVTNTHVPREKIDKNAVIVLGFSGNGKTTWIRNFKKYAEEYAVVSMDEVVNDIFDQTQRKATWQEVIKEFGRRIEENARNNKPIVIDGNFLNLLTRSALIGTLRSFNYQVTLIDLTDSIEDILPRRVMERVEKELNVKITDENLESIRETETFKKAFQEIIDFHFKERKSSEFEEQVRFKVTTLGADKVLGPDSPIEEIKSLKNPQL